MGFVPELKSEYLVYATGATVPLPTNFYAMSSNPRIYSNGWLEYPEIEAEEKYTLDSGDRFSYVLGTPQAKNLILNSPVEGTLSLIYQKIPSRLCYFN
ncbi:MAG: hypothetical protein KatS3mg101_0972 [Patescibacteria group bacterium]|nr:MAG: hypothetical protein KatS3mg101_0972 [Patescibacteria group bacterium]